MAIEIEDLKKVSLNDGDVVIFKVKERLGNAQVESVCKMLKFAFPDNKAIIIEDGMEIDVVGPDSFARTVSNNIKQYEFDREILKDV